MRVNIAGGFFSRKGSDACSTSCPVEDCGATRHPDLDEIPGFERTSIEGKAKTYGDILTSHNGRQVVIDVRFSSRTDMTVSQLEEDKTNEYKRNRNFDAAGFIPFIVHDIEWFMGGSNDQILQRNRDGEKVS